MKTTMKDGETEEARNAARTASLIRIAQFGSPASMVAFSYLAEEQKQKEATGVSDNETNTEPVNDLIDWFDCNVLQFEGVLSCCGGGQEFVNED